MKTIKLIYKASIMLFISISLFTNCDSPIGEIKIDRDTKDYCLFDQGSYWIYQDSATLETDSVIINNPVEYRFSRSNGNGYDCETYHIGITSYSHDTISSFGVRLTTAHADSKLLKPCVLMRNLPKYTYYHNGGVSEKVPNFWNTVLLDKKDNYLINGVVFNNVKIFEYNYFNEKKMYYWAKHVGLTRMEIYENDTVVTVRNLIEHNVKPYHQ